MKISTRGRYALRLLLELATKAEGEYTSLKDVSGRQGISVKYLEQITGSLSKSGMIKSARGAQGGYRLARKPEEYTVGDILRVTEGSLAPVACLEEGAEECQRKELCSTIDLWKGLEKVISDYLDGITLADLVEKDKAKTGWEYMI